MQGGKRKLSQWNIFVKKIYREGTAKNSNYEFKQALSDASKRKSEMGSMKNSSSSNSSKKSRKMNKSKGKRHMAMAMAGGTRKRRRH